MIESKYKIEYNGEIIPYELVRAKIKNLYIYVKDKRVIVKAPIKLKQETIYNFINKKTEWIYKHIKQEKEKKLLEDIITPKDIDALELIVQNNIEKYSRLLKVKPNKVRIKDLKYAWGSCSSKKNISINMKLANKNEKAIEYVVLHEMCHLKHMNHSEKFWNLIEQFMPEYKEYRAMLK